MYKKLVLIAAIALFSGHVSAVSDVTEIAASHAHGQTFITWKDVSDGDAGSNIHYAVYRSTETITQETLSKAEKRVWNISQNSGQIYTFVFSNSGKPVDRSNPAIPGYVIETGKPPIPSGHGLAVITPDKPGKAYYAVVAESAGSACGAIVPGKNATQQPVDESPAPIEPVKVNEGKDPVSHKPVLRGEKGSSLVVSLHASGGFRGPASRGETGDYYNFFCPRAWAFREGLPGVFSVEANGPNGLKLAPVDAVQGLKDDTTPMETFWFGCACVPQWASHAEQRAYPFSERRLLWMIDWVIKAYGIDTEHVTGAGQSMGGWGSMSVLMRHPEIFAALHPTMPRMRQRGLPNAKVYPLKGDEVMDDGKTCYLDRMDTVKFVSEHHEDLPFLGWSIGRHDGFATWKEQVDMVKALTANGHGFAFAWNDGNHSEGPKPMEIVRKYYPDEKFALHKSYPAFAHSSIDNDLGTGELDDKKELKDGEKTGGINLGFVWSDLSDASNTWSVKLSNDLCQADMTVDVTPRRCQQFKLKPGEKFKWATSTGSSGEGIANAWGLVTAQKIVIKPGAATTLTISR